MKKYRVKVVMTADFLYQEIEATSKQEAIIFAEDRAEQEWEKGDIGYPNFKGKVEPEAHWCYCDCEMSNPHIH